MTGPRRMAIDAGIATVAGVINAIMIHEALEPHSRAPDAFAYTLGVLMTLPVLLHRRRPVAALLASSVLLFAYYSSDYPGISPITVLAVPLYSAVVAGHLRWAVGVISAFYVGGYIIVVFNEKVEALRALSEFLTNGGLAVTVILLAEVVRNRRQLAAETRERLRIAAEEREIAAARRVAEDRVRIARELHDTVAHSMATITVQARTALHVHDEDPASEDVRTALSAIRETSKRALREMGDTLGVLRAEPREDGDGVGLERLPALVEAVRAAGVPVELAVTGTAAALAPAVDHAAYRILQESLTNVLRHAGPEVNARVNVTYGPDGVALEIADDGVGTSEESGHGLNGMRERAEGLGGTLTAGPGDGGGFVVSARLPGDAA
ncbi:sensor histidine kinase [Spirillospora sp. NPDC048911]|uniref:sensor histidine kinase n=1 Tax=Spirillospora sp. NPDC048911 TaxID=3364527 RepID=UPI003715A233